MNPTLIQLLFISSIWLIYYTHFFLSERRKKLNLQKPENQTGKITEKLFQKQNVSLYYIYGATLIALLSGSIVGGAMVWIDLQSLLGVLYLGIIILLFAFGGILASLVYWYKLHRKYPQEPILKLFFKREFSPRWYLTIQFGSDEYQLFVNQHIFNSYQIGDSISQADFNRYRQWDLNPQIP